MLAVNNDMEPKDMNCWIESGYDGIVFFVGGSEMISQLHVIKRAEYKEIDRNRWSSMPDPQDNGRFGGEIWMWPQIRCHVQIDPMNIRDEPYLCYPFAISVFDHHGKHILSAVLEQTDYRELARMTGEQLKAYTGKTGQRFSDISAVVYLPDERKDFGLYDDEMTFETAREFLLGLVADELDVIGEPVFKGPL